MVHKIPTIQPFSLRREWYMVTALALAVLMLCLFSLDGFCFWGDDYAAYINQAIALSEGRFDEQARLNYIMHPSIMVEEAEKGELVYVWGYPLILSLCYALAGFDRTLYTSIALYKLPSVLALAWLAAVLYPFYRKRMGKALSFMLTLLFCCCGEFFSFIDTLYSDLVFLFFAVLALYLSEKYSEQDTGKSRFALAFLLGAVLWFMNEIRLNGIAILFACAVGQAIVLIKKHRKLSKGETAMALLPYMILAVLTLVSSLILSPATGNNSDMERALLSLFISNLRYYFELIWHWLGLLMNSLFINPLYSVLRRIIPISFESLGLIKNILCALCAVLALMGIILDGIRRNAHLSLLILVYIIFVSLLPYTQGLRYIYPLLPLVLLFIGCSLQRILSRVGEMAGNSRILKAGGILVFALLCFFTVLPRVSDIGDNEKNESVTINSVADIYMQNAYSPAAIEAYNFIQQNIPEDSVIAFFTPRGLYLNTQRLSVKPGVNGHSMEEADYYLRYLLMGEYEIFPEPGEEFEPVFENSEFILYKKTG